MTVPLKQLETLNFFQGLGASDLQKISQIMTHRQIYEGELMTRRGDMAQTFFIILRGNFMLFSKNGEAITLHDKGEVIGISTVLHPSGYRRSTIALTDGEVIQARGDEFFKLIQSRSSIGDKLMQRLGQAAEQRLAVASQESPDDGTAIQAQTPAGPTSVFESIIP